MLELSTFEPMVGQTFTCSPIGTDVEIEAVLTEVRLIKSAKLHEDDRDPFALTFKFPPELGIDQANFHLKAASGEEFDMVFLVTVRADESEWIMDASFA